MRNLWPGESPGFFLSCLLPLSDTKRVPDFYNVWSHSNVWPVSDTSRFACMMPAFSARHLAKTLALICASPLRQPAQQGEAKSRPRAFLQDRRIVKSDTCSVDNI